MSEDSVRFLISKLIGFSCANFLVHLLAKNVFNVNIIGINVKDIFGKISRACLNAGMRCVNKQLLSQIDAC